MQGWEYGGKGQNVHGYLLWTLPLAASYIQINKGMQQIRDGHGKGIPNKFPWESHGNGNKTPVLEWEWERP